MDLLAADQLGVHRDGVGSDADLAAYLAAFRAMKELPEARDELLVPRNLDTSALAATLPFVGPSLAMPAGMLVGLARTSQTPVLLDPFDRSLDNANLAVVAPAGSVKSFFCKLLMLRELINGTTMCGWRCTAQRNPTLRCFSG